MDDLCKPTILRLKWRDEDYKIVRLGRKEELIDWDDPHDPNRGHLVNLDECCDSGSFESGSGDCYSIEVPITSLGVNGDLNILYTPPSTGEMISQVYHSFPNISEDPNIVQILVCSQTIPQFRYSFDTIIFTNSNWTNQICGECCSENGDCSVEPIPFPGYDYTVTHLYAGKDICFGGEQEDYITFGVELNTTVDVQLTLNCFIRYIEAGGNCNTGPFVHEPISITVEPGNSEAHYSCGSGAIHRPNAIQMCNFDNGYPIRIYSHSPYTKYVDYGNFS